MLSLTPVSLSEANAFVARCHRHHKPVVGHMPEDAERQGLGTPATLASILEKLVQMGFVERKGKQLLPTKDGHNLACVLPDVLTSPQLTADWENTLTAIAKGEADPDGFMAGIEEMTRGLISGYSQISEDVQKLFQKERVAIGKCPRCGEAVYEGKKWSPRTPGRLPGVPGRRPKWECCRTGCGQPPEGCRHPPAVRVPGIK